MQCAADAKRASQRWRDCEDARRTWEDAVTVWEEARRKMEESGKACLMLAKKQEEIRERLGYMCLRTVSRGNNCWTANEQNYVGAIQESTSQAAQNSVGKSSAIWQSVIPDLGLRKKNELR